MFIGEINVFEVSGGNSSERHYILVINILWFTLKFQSTLLLYSETFDYLSIKNACCILEGLRSFEIIKLFSVR